MNRPKTERQIPLRLTKENLPLPLHLLSLLPPLLIQSRAASLSVSLYSTLDFLPLLRPTLHTTAAPRKIFFQGRRYRKAKQNLAAFAPCLSALFSFLALRFSGASFPLSTGGHGAFPACVTLFPPPRLMLSGSRVFACPSPSPRFPHACLFVRRYPGGPAYVTCTRAAALYTLRLARGCRPFEPRQRPKP